VETITQHRRLQYMPLHIHISMHAHTHTMLTVNCWHALIACQAATDSLLAVNHTSGRLMVPLTQQVGVDEVCTVWLSLVPRPSTPPVLIACSIQTIKNWRHKRPGNEAIMAPIG